MMPSQASDVPGRLRLAQMPGVHYQPPPAGARATFQPGPAMPIRRAARQDAPPARRPARPVLTGWFVAGAHGGAGTSTLAALLRAEVAVAWPDARLPVHDLHAFPDRDAAEITARTALPGPIAGPFIVAARGNAEGARRAITAVAALGYLGVRPAVLAVISDGAGPLPRTAAQRLDLLGDRAGTIILVPFAAALRAAASPQEARLPRPVRRAVTAIAEAAASRSAEGNWR
jgi:hypothetical protein